MDIKRMIMDNVTLTLLEGEVRDILQVLGQLPTSSNAWPLLQKIAQQLPAPAAPAPAAPAPAAPAAPAADATPTA
jgi:hypothetical protein